MGKELQALIFDCDGVLVDTEHLYFRFQDRTVPLKSVGALTQDQETKTDP